MQRDMSVAEVNADQRHPLGRQGGGRLFRPDVSRPSVFEVPLPKLTFRRIIRTAPAEELRSRIHLPSIRIIRAADLFLRAFTVFEVHIGRAP